MKALDLVVSDKKIFENCILKTYIFNPWPTYTSNWNGLNNFDRGPPRDHSCLVWSKSNKWFQGRCCLKKLLMHGRTDGRWTTDNGPSQKLTLSTLCLGELKRRKNRIRKGPRERPHVIQLPHDVCRNWLNGNDKSTFCKIFLNGK